MPLRSDPMAAMMPPPLLFCITMYVATFGFVDRFNGGGFCWDKLELPGRGIYYIAPWILSFTWHASGWPLLVAALIWCLYRAALGFWTGTLNGRNLGVTILRHGILVPAMLVWARFFEKPILYTAVSTTIYAAIAVLLAVWVGKQEDKGRDVVGIAEILRGVAFGTVFAYWAHLDVT